MLVQTIALITVKAIKLNSISGINSISPSTIPNDSHTFHLEFY